MAEFKKLTDEEKRNLEELLKTADKVLYSESLVLEENPEMTQIIGKAIGGARGAAIASGAIGALSVGGSSLGGVGAAGLGGIGAFGMVSVAPFVAPVALAGLLGLLIFGNKKKKERQEEALKQKNYCEDIVKKMQLILDKYVALNKQLTEENKKKDSIIKKQQEFIGKSKLIMASQTEALKKQMEEISKLSQQIHEMEQTAMKREKKIEELNLVYEGLKSRRESIEANLANV